MQTRKFYFGILAIALVTAANAGEWLSMPYDGLHGAPPSRIVEERSQAAQCVESMLANVSGRCNRASGAPESFDTARRLLLAAGQRVQIVPVSGSDMQKRSEDARILYLEYEDESRPTGIDE